MAQKKSYFTVDEANKIIIIDPSVKPTQADHEKVRTYGAFGFNIHTKKKASAKQKLNKAQIREALKDNKEALSKFDKMCEKDGFMKARSEALKVIDNQKEAEPKKKEEK